MEVGVGPVEISVGWVWPVFQVQLVKVSKGIMSPVEFFLKAYKIKLVLSVHALMVLNL